MVYFYSFQITRNGIDFMRGDGIIECKKKLQNYKEINEVYEGLKKDEIEDCIKEAKEKGMILDEKELSIFFIAFNPMF